MGYPIDLFTDPHVNYGFRCAICQDVLKTQRVLVSCHHAYCRTCVEQWRLNSNTCPIDRIPITRLKWVEPYFMSALNELQMRCPFHSAGCTAIFKLGDFDDHDERCVHNPENQKECAEGCGAIVSQAQVRLRIHSCVAHLKQKLAEKDALLQAKNTKLARKTTELRAVLAAWGKSKEEIRKLKRQVEERNNNQFNQFHHCRKRKWNPDSSDQATSTSRATQIQKSLPLTATEFRWTLKKNVGPKLYKTIVGIVCDELTLTDCFFENIENGGHRHHIADAEDQLEETLNDANPTLDSEPRRPSLCGPYTAGGRWNVWICLEHENFPQLARQLAAAAKIQLRLEVRNVKILVLQRYKVD